LLIYNRFRERLESVVRVSAPVDNGPVPPHKRAQMFVVF
jgi:hypothetical protein